MIRLLPRPLSSTPLPSASCLSFSIFLSTYLRGGGGGGRGRGAKSYDREKAWLSRNRWILSGEASSLPVAHTCVKWLTAPHENLKCNKKDTVHSTCYTCHPPFAYLYSTCTHVSLPCLIKGTVRLWIRLYILSLATSYFGMLLGPELTLTKNDFRIKKHVSWGYFASEMITTLFRFRKVLRWTEKMQYHVDQKIILSWTNPFVISKLF